MNTTMTCSVRNVRPYMEDRHNVRHDIVPGVTLLAVYDGHGGSAVSARCARLFPQIVKQRLEGIRRFPSSRDCEDALENGIGELDTKCKKDGLHDQIGSTLCAALVIPSANEIIVANVGDSRMVLIRGGRRTEQVTVDHGVACLSERKRITDLGGLILRDAFGMDRVMGVLNLTRSIGDWYLRPYLSATPNIATHAFGNADSVCLATDGLWDVVASREVKDLCKQRRGQKNIARDMVREAMKRGSTDNITVVLYFNRSMHHQRAK